MFKIWSRHSLLNIVGDRMVGFLIFPSTVVPILLRHFKLWGKINKKKRFSAIPSFNDRLKKFREGMSDVVKPFLRKCRYSGEEIAVWAADFMEYLKSVGFSYNYGFSHKWIFWDLALGNQYYNVYRYINNASMCLLCLGSLDQLCHTRMWMLILVHWTDSSRFVLHPLWWCKYSPILSFINTLFCHIIIQC